MQCLEWLHFDSEVTGSIKAQDKSVIFAIKSIAVLKMISWNSLKGLFDHVERDKGDSLPIHPGLRIEGHWVQIGQPRTAIE